MKSTVLTFAVLLLIGLMSAVPLNCSAAQQAKPPVKHVILISLDAFNPQWYQDERWPMPFLQQMASEGAYARRAKPPFPSTTRPGHVTLITGRFPANHGVYNNSIPYHIEDGSSIFHGVEDAGGETASVVWVGANHAPVDHLVNNIGVIDFSDAELSPPSEDLISSSNWEKKEGHSPKFERYIQGTIRDAQLASIAVTYIERYQPNFLALRFNDTDKTQHMFGRDGAAVKGKVASIDMALAEVNAAVERAGIAAETVIIVTGDHGMDSISNMVSPNVWLAESGLGSKDGVKFDTYGGSAFLYNSDEEETKEIAEMLKNLPEVEKNSFTLLSRSELDELGADPRATLALSAAEGYAFNNGWNDPVLKSVNLHGTHGSLATPETPNNYTGFVIWGAGIKKGTVLEEIRLQDIAPTAAEFLEINIGESDGKSRFKDLTVE
ncbi:MAG: nucleotide pyrophosphatase/phosphodiesterase family protein [Balneolaceae bacterium]